VSTNRSTVDEGVLRAKLIGSNMQKAIAIVILAAALAGCDVVNTVTEGFKQAKAVEADIAEATGVKPNVGFSWNNGRLTSVTVSFPKLYEDKPLRELAALSRAAVVKEFKQTPKTILLSFALDAGMTAEAAVPHAVN
jgi:hypothetical protein